MRRIILILLCATTTWLADAQTWDRPVRIQQLNISVRANLFTATTFIEIEFFNPNDREVEGLYSFSLEPGQVITDFQLELNGKYRDGSIEEKRKATTAYNTIVGKRIDPALLTMDQPDKYSLRIFPFAPFGTRKVTITIQQLLKTANDEVVYSLPLRIHDTITNARLDINVEGTTIRPMTGKGWLADSIFSQMNNQWSISSRRSKFRAPARISFSIPLPVSPVVCISPGIEGNKFAVRLTPQAKSEFSVSAKSATVFWDISASAGNRQISKEIYFLKQFIAYHGISKLTIVTFNHRIKDTVVFFPGESRYEWREFLESLIYDGATQLGCINPSLFESDVYFVFSDGRNTYGKSMPASDKYLMFAITTDPKADIDNLVKIVGFGGGKVLPLNGLSVANAIKQSSEGQNWVLDITSANGRSIIPTDNRRKLGEPLLIRGTMFSGTDTLYFHYGNKKQANSTQMVILSKEQVCSDTSISRMEMLSNFESVIRYGLWEDQLEFGLNEKVVTNNSAYIVLERIEDYIKYNITPPKELEEACEKLNYVRKHTRYERKLIRQIDEFKALKLVVDNFNQSLAVYDPTAKPLMLEKPDYKTSEAFASASSKAADNKIVLDELNASNVIGNEVVVTALGIRRREKAIGYSITGVDPNTVFQNAEPDLLAGLQGRVPGVDIRSSNGTPGSATRIQIRGNSSFGSANQPLIVVDGIPFNENSFDGTHSYGSSLANLHPASIESFEIIRSAQAASVYGSRAVNGVILITTKKGSKNDNWKEMKYKLKNMYDLPYITEIREAEREDKKAVYKFLQLTYSNDPVFYFDVARHFFETGLKDDAFEVLMTGVENSENNLQVLEGVAFVLERWKYYEEAIRVYKELVSAKPAAIVFQRNLAWAYLLNGDVQEAVNTLYKGIRIGDDPDQLAVKSAMLMDLNGIVSMYKDSVDVSEIPASLIRPMKLGLRMIITSNHGGLHGLRVIEPGGTVCTPVYRQKGNEGVLVADQKYTWTQMTFAHYHARKFIPGKYKVSINYNGYNGLNAGPAITRIISIRNFGTKDQTVEVRNIMLNNQGGEIEIAELKL